LRHIGSYRLGSDSVRWRFAARVTGGRGIGHHRHQGLAHVGCVARWPIATGIAVASVAVATAALAHLAVLGAFAIRPCALAKSCVLLVRACFC
jgi:hypothetical protein